MAEWIEGFQESIRYIEDHLTEEVDIKKAADLSGLSQFYYQRLFGALCGMTVGAYIRGRRMTCAAQELAASEAKVLDIALKYGYESPDSFAKAFQRFHGITPMMAKEKGAMLSSMAPLHIKITLEGGNMLDYKITEKAPFTIVGMKRKFQAEDSYEKIPKFWEEWMKDNKGLCGMFGVCVDSSGSDFDYWIADLYEPWKEIPEGCETMQIPGSLWAQFICRGPLPQSLQSVNTEIWSEWVPNLKGYKLAGMYNIEAYEPPAENPEDNVSYIWVPLEKI